MALLFLPVGLSTQRLKLPHVMAASSEKHFLHVELLGYLEGIQYWGGFSFWSHIVKFTHKIYSWEAVSIFCLAN